MHTHLTGKRSDKGTQLTFLAKTQFKTKQTKKQVIKACLQKKLVITILQIHAIESNKKSHESWDSTDIYPKIIKPAAKDKQKSVLYTTFTKDYIVLLLFWDHKPS